jgi:hypothetical protein
MTSWRLSSFPRLVRGRLKLHADPVTVETADVSIIMPAGHVPLMLQDIRAPGRGRATATEAYGYIKRRHG